MYLASLSLRRSPGRGIFEILFSNGEFDPVVPLGLLMLGTGSRATLK